MTSRSTLPRGSGPRFSCAAHIRWSSRRPRPWKPLMSAASWNYSDPHTRCVKMSNVLVVDDSSTVRDEVSTFLRAGGLDVTIAVDGKDGLTKLKADPGIKLVVADVNMPNMDGLTMVEKIRGELRNTTVNIVMLTTESSPNMKERGKAAGVKGWIVKPFNGPAVLATFRKLAS